jgi:hypothetical protein
VATAVNRGCLAATSQVNRHFAVRLTAIELERLATRLGGSRAGRDGGGESFAVFGSVRRRGDVMRVLLSKNWLALMLFAVEFAVSSGVSLGFDPPPAAKANELSDGDIASAVRDLASDQFEKREVASRLLVRGGPRSVKALAVAIDSEQLEVACRAVAILHDMYLTGDDETSNAAENLLDKLSESAIRPVARRALAALGSQEAVRHERARKRIEELGGEVTYDGPQSAAFRANNMPNGIGIVQWVIIEPDWKGGDDGLLLIRRLGDVRAVYLANNPPVSQEAIRRLEESIPGISILYRGGKLGMKGQPHTRGASIYEVQEDSASERAGLLAGDIITHYDGQSLADEAGGKKGWDLLIELNLKKRPGDKVRLEILRPFQAADEEEQPARDASGRRPRIVSIEVADPANPDKNRTMKFWSREVELTLGSWKRPVTK